MERIRSYLVIGGEHVPLAWPDDPEDEIEVLRTTSGDFYINRSKSSSNDS